MVGTANTHWLNSLGMKTGYTLLGHQPWQLRIFSIASWLLYGFSAIKISNALTHKILGFALFIVLTLNPFVLDFFSLARGYGLTCAFVLACMWQITKLLKEEIAKPNDWQTLLVFAMLALFSNYTSLYFLMALIAAFIFFCILKKKWNVLWQPMYKNWYILVIGAGVFAVANLLFIKLYTKDLEYGGDTDMGYSLLGSMIRGTLYFHGNETLITIITYVILFLIIVCFAYAFYQYNKYRKITPLVFTATMLLFISLLSFGFHIAFGTPYLFSRTTLMLYPCIATMFFYFFNDISIAHSKTKLLVHGLGFSVIIVMTIHFFSCFNFKYCFEWIEQAESKGGFDFLAYEKARHVVLHKWHYGVFANYYKQVAPAKYSFEAEELAYNVPDVEEDLYLKAQHSDYALLLPPYDLQKIRQKGLQFEIQKRFPLTNSIVIKFLNKAKE